MKRSPRSKTLRNKKQSRKGSQRDTANNQRFRSEQRQEVDERAGISGGREIEVRFIADGKERTRIELEHRRLDRFGERRDQMRRVFDQEGDWGKLLAMFARVAEGASS